MNVNIMSYKMCILLHPLGAKSCSWKKHISMMQMCAMVCILLLVYVRYNTTSKTVDHVDVWMILIRYVIDLL